MKKFIILLILLFSVSVFANDKVESMTKYKDNYFIAGDEDLKFQISAKYSLIYNSGLYLAYTELAFWDIYKKSGPFREFNHNPEAFWQYENFYFIDFIKAGFYEHKSNGRDGEFSRGFDRGYGEGQISYGDHYNIGLRGKGWKWYKKSTKNADIDNYLGNFESELFFKIKSTTTEGLEKEKLYVRGGGKKDKFGWIECGIVSRIFTSRIQPRLFGQFYYGYAQDLVNYNLKEKQFRGGVIF